jgi:Rieske Fe-S protein
MALAGLIGVGVVLGSIKLPTPASTATTTQTQSGLPSGAIANVSAIKPGSPVYFEYPKGYPNILMMSADGSLSALSILCTHVCCECEYIRSNKVIACPCHGSVFDLSGSVVNGPAIVPLPSISLRTDGSGNVFPTGVSSAGPCQV